MDKILDFAHACYKQRTTPLQDWSWGETKHELETAHKAHIDKTTGDHGYHTANVASTTDQKPAATDTPSRGRTGPQPVTLNKNQWIFTYCHLCRWSNNRGHDSSNCTATKPGHKKDATVWDNKDGNQEVTVSRKCKGEPNAERLAKKK
jgi:hypothetical protein